MKDETPLARHRRLAESWERARREELLKGHRFCAAGCAQASQWHCIEAEKLETLQRGETL